jgi:hypothetical protein
MTSTTSAPTSSNSAASVRTASSSSAPVIRPGSGVPVPGMNAGSSTSASTVRNTARGRSRRSHAGPPRRCRGLAQGHEQAGHATLGLPGELTFTGSVAAPADLHIAPGIDLACLDHAPHKRAVRALDMHFDTHAEIAACELPGSAGTTAASPKSTTLRSANASTFASRCGPGGQLAPRMARGVRRATGRSDTRSSIGAPTTTTSQPRARRDPGRTVRHRRSAARRSPASPRGKPSVRVGRS